MRTGEMISVEAKAGRVIAQVLDVRATEELPALPILHSAEARRILAEQFRRAAVIGYRFGVERIPVMFVALEDVDGNWWDLHGHALALAPASQKEESECPAHSTDDTPSKRTA